MLNEDPSDLFQISDTIQDVVHNIHTLVISGTHNSRFVNDYILSSCYMQTYDTCISSLALFCNVLEGGSRHLTSYSVLFPETHRPTCQLCCCKNIEEYNTYPVM